MGHRHGGAAAQDKAAEALFHSYFAKEKAPNDPEELKEAAKAAGLDSTSVHLDSVSMPHVEMQILDQIGFRNTRKWRMDWMDMLKIECGKECGKEWHKLSVTWLSTLVKALCLFVVAGESSWSFPSIF